jgi:hypothetical protein
MASNKKWFTKFIVGNPNIFSQVRTDPDSPMLRSRALESVTVIENNGWRGWVEDAEGRRIYETEVEKQFSQIRHDL